jgi:hypothetical protein
LNIVRSIRLYDALQKPSKAMREVETELAAMKGDRPLASHIFVSRRQYRKSNDTKSGKRREISARLTFNTACEWDFAAPWTNGSG